MTEPPTKTCRACGDVLPIEQFRLLPPRKPTWAPSRYSWCRTCERESNRVRCAHNYHTDPVYRVKQIANAAVQRERQAARCRGVTG